MFEKKIEKEKRNKIILIISAVFIVVATVVGIVFMINDNSNELTEPEEFSEVIGDKRNKFIVFYNLDLLTNIYNIEISTTFATEFENYVMSDTEMQFSGVNNPVEEDANVYYDATIDIVSFESYDLYTVGFEVTISDGRVYEVIVQTDSLDENYTYIYSAIKRKGGEIHFIADGDEKDLDKFEKLAEEIIE